MFKKCVVFISLLFFHPLTILYASPDFPDVKEDKIQRLVKLHEDALEMAKKSNLFPPQLAWIWALAEESGVDAYRRFDKDFEAYESAFKKILALRFDPSATDEKIDDGETIALQYWEVFGDIYDKCSDATFEGGGSWTRTPPGFFPAVLPHWGTAHLWSHTNLRSLLDGVVFPDESTDDYKSGFAEVFELGELNSKTRTEKQTFIAKFWAAGPKTVMPPGMWLRITIHQIAKKRPSLDEALNTLKAVTMAMSNAGVAAWEKKYAPAIQRPVTAIHRAGYETWQPLLITPPFPTFVSGHSAFSAAAAQVLTELLPLDENELIYVTSDIYPGVLQPYASYWQAAEDAGLSRIYGGIHFPADNKWGQVVGRRAACEVLRTQRNIVCDPVSVAGR